MTYHEMNEVTTIAELTRQGTFIQDMSASVHAGSGWIWNPSVNKFVYHEGEQAPLACEMYSLGDFAALAKEARKRITEGGLLVFAGRGQIEAAPDFDRRQRMLMKLHETVQFKQIREVERGSGMGQKGLLDWLRIGVAGCVAPEVIAAFRAIKFSTNAEGQAEVRNSRESLDRRVTMAAAAGGKDIPEEISLEVAVYEELPELKRSLRMAVVTDMQEQKFVLKPLAGEIPRVQRETDEEICKQISTMLDGHTVACGRMTS